jgi:hypothetical protein
MTEALKKLSEDVDLRDLQEFSPISLRATAATAEIDRRLIDRPSEYLE